MSRAFLSDSIRTEMGITRLEANKVTACLLDALVRELKASGRFNLPKFGTFRVSVNPARKAMNPRTGEKIRVKKSKAVRFKASPTLRKRV